MTDHFQRLEQRVDNDLHHICASIRYPQTCVDDTYNSNDWPASLPSSHSRPLSLIGPPFKPWVPPSIVPDAPVLPEDPDFQEDWPLLLMTKRGRDIGWSYLWELVFMFGSIYFMYLDMYFVLWTYALCGCVVCIWFWGWHEPLSMYVKVHLEGGE